MTSNLERRLERLDPPTGKRSVCDLSEAELHARMIALLRKRLNDTALSHDLRADVIGQIGNLEAGETSRSFYTAARVNRIIAALKAYQPENRWSECRS